MKLIQEKIEEIKKNGYSLTFENTFETAIANYKKIAVYAGLMLLVFLLLFFGIIFGIVFSYFDIETVRDNLTLLSENPDALSKEFIVSYFAVTIIMSCLLSPFQAGFLKMADCGQKNEEFHVSTIFEYYKLPYFLSIVWATLLITLPGLAITILLEHNGLKYIGTIITLTISFLTFLTIPLIVFGKLNTIESIKSSFVIMSKNALILLGLIIVAGIFSIVGIFGCGVGIFFTIPFLYSMTYAIYSTIIGFESNADNENLEENN